MKIEPAGKLTAEDRVEIYEFQAAEPGLVQDGKLGHQMWHYMSDLIAEERAKVDRLHNELERLMAGCEADRNDTRHIAGAFVAGVVVAAVAFWALSAVV